MWKSIKHKLKITIKFLIEFIVFLIAWILILPLTLLNLFAVLVKYGSVTKYFINTSRNIDIFGNKEYRTLFGYTLLSNKSVVKFGKDETISSVLGKNQQNKTLSIAGRLLVWILNLLDKNHCQEAAESFKHII